MRHRWLLYFCIGILAVILAVFASVGENSVPPKSVPQQKAETKPDLDSIPSVPIGPLVLKVETVGGPGFRDGKGDNARFCKPGGMDFDKAGNLYVADTGNHTIRKISPEGIVSTLAGKPGVSGRNNGKGEAARFNSPSDVAVDSRGNVYVADTENYAIRKITPAGVVSYFGWKFEDTGNGRNSVSEFRWDRPKIVEVDSENYVYFYGTQNHHIYRVSPEGVLWKPRKIRRTNSGRRRAGRALRFKSVSGLAVDEDGDIYISDSENREVLKIDMTHRVTTFANKYRLNGYEENYPKEYLKRARLSAPATLALDPAGNFHILEYRNGNIIKLSADGVGEKLLLKGHRQVVTGSGDWNGGFTNPQGMAIDRNGIVYVADTDRHTIRKIIPEEKLYKRRYKNHSVYPVAGKSLFAKGGDRSEGKPPLSFNWHATDESGNSFTVDRFKHTSWFGDCRGSRDSFCGENRRKR